MLAPQVMATKRLALAACACSTYCLMAATPSAPAGSRMLRVSWNTSLMAAQTASVSTTTKSSTSSRARRKVSSPTSLTAVPSENRPDVGQRARACRRCTERSIASESAVCTPITWISGPHRLDVGGHARDQPAAADGHEHRVDRALVLAQDLHRDRALAGDHVGVVEGVHEGQALRLLQRPARARRRRSSCRRAAPPRRPAPARRRPSAAAWSPASRSRRGSPAACAASATPWAWLPAEAQMTPRCSCSASGAPSCCRRRAA